MSWPNWTQEEEREWLLRMIALEEERGPFLPHGFGGGAGVGMRRQKRELERQVEAWESEGGAL